MKIDGALRKRGIRRLSGFAFWTFIGLAFAFQFHLSSAKAGLDVSWKQAISYALGDWYVFAVLSIPVIALSRRFSFDAGVRLAVTVVHIVASVVFSLAYMVVRAWVGVWQSGGDFPDAFQPLLVKTWHFDLLIYWVIVAVSFAFDYYRKFRERELRAAELQRELAQARLHALQMQLNPHFLFNSLHSISSLMHRNVDAADNMIAQLGELLRATLENSEANEVTLREELDFLQRYLALEQIRFGDRLNVYIDVPPETLKARVPNLILQPLVENAIRHGIEPRANRGRIELRATRSEHQLLLEVSDNGVGLPEDKPIAEGVGLTNTRARLRTLYGEAHELELANGSGKGLTVRLTIPFKIDKIPS